MTPFSRFLLFIVLSVSTNAFASAMMAVVGDSSVTGAASDPRIQASVGSLLGEIFGFLSESRMTDNPGRYEFYSDPSEFRISNPVEPVTRVAYTSAEFADASDSEKVSMNFDLKAALKLDVEEYSFGYMIGRSLGVNAKDILIVGEDGKKVRTLSQQFARIFETGIKTLPPLVLVSYVANDFCDEGTFGRSSESFEEYLHEQIFSQIEDLKKWPANSQGTKVVILAPLDVSQILISEDLLSQIVPLEGQALATCRDLRDQTEAAKTKGNPLASGIKKTLSSECKSVLRGDTRDPQKIAKIQLLQNIQIKVWREFILEVSKHTPQIEWTLANSTREIIYKNGDLANDCFHPGIKAHERIARQLLDNELRAFSF
jgi:hypothetical protein